MPCIKVPFSISDNCLLVTGNVEGELEYNNQTVTCDTILGILGQGFQHICLNGTFINRTEHLKIADGTKIVVYANEAVFKESKIILEAAIANYAKVTFKDTTFQNCLLILGAMDVDFIDCQFDQTSITDLNSTSDGNFANIQITIDMSSMTCRQDISSPSGFILQHRPILTLAIRNSDIGYCVLSIKASEIFLEISESSFTEGIFQIDTKSFLRVPSIILISQSNFIYQNPLGNPPRIFLDIAC